MVRVLHIPCDLAGGGAERLVLDLCRRASPGFAHAVAPLHPTGSLRASFQQAGIPIHDLGRWRGGPGLLALGRIARLSRRFDLVHTHLWAGDVWGRLGAGLAAHPAVVGTEHNTRPEASWRQALAARLAPLSHRIVAVSEAARQGLLAAGVAPARLRVIENGVDLARFTPAPRARGRVRRVLAIGRLVPQKGFDLLVQAMAGLPELELRIVGEGPQADQLRGPQVELRGWVPDVPALLSQAELVVVPSRWEGFGLVAVEAMASGVPVIASDVPGLREVLGEAAVRVPPGDVRALREAIAAVAADPVRRLRMQEEGLAQASRFRIEACVAAYEALYAELLTAS
jgi:glycosyltransferase involved in cell wall biosynthesis